MQQYRLRAGTVGVLKGDCFSLLAHCHRRSTRAVRIDPSKIRREGGGAANPTGEIVAAFDGGAMERHLYDIFRREKEKLAGQRRER